MKVCLTPDWLLERGGGAKGRLGSTSGTSSYPRTNIFITRTYDTQTKDARCNKTGRNNYLNS